MREKKHATQSASRMKTKYEMPNMQQKNGKLIPPTLSDGSAPPHRHIQTYAHTRSRTWMKQHGTQDAGEERPPMADNFLPLPRPLHWYLTFDLLLIINRNEAKGRH